MTERHVRWIGAIVFVFGILVATQYVRAAGPHRTNTANTTDTAVVPDTSSENPFISLVGP